VRPAPAGAIDGVVRGAATTGLTVELAAQAAPGVWRTVDVRRFAGPRFAVSDLAPGPLRIAVRAADGRHGEAEVRLAPGERVAVELALR
jgi:hypothetical protein